MRLTRLIAESIYLRDVPRFRNVAILSLLGGFIENGIYAARSWLQYQLVRKWQARLVHHLHDAYFGRSAFYRQQLLPTAVPDSDERICQDVQRSVTNLAWMLDEVVESVLMGVYYAVRLGWELHPYYIGVVVLYSWLSVKLRSILSPPLATGQLGGQVSEVTGRYFGAHQKLLQHSEAIAAAGGGEREAGQIEACFQEFLGKWRSMCRLNLRSSFAMRIQWSVMQSVLMSCLVHVPFLRGTHPLRAAADATDRQRVEANAAILGRMSFSQDLIMRTLSTVGEIFRINRSLKMYSGSNVRIAELLAALEAVGTDHPGEAADRSEGDDEIPLLESADIDSPSGERLVSGLDLTIRAGSNLLIVGGNGVGKTSLFRAVRGLWPLAGGKVFRQSPEDCVYLPQSPYVLRSDSTTLQDQLTFPKRLPAGALSAEEQSNLLEMVGLEELAGRKDIDWGSLTFGEKQRLSLLRIFYHKPRYAVIDEATAGLGLRTERRIFERCRAMGIALVVVAQQRSLLQFCDSCLTLSGGGEWEQRPVDAAERSPLLRALSTEINEAESNVAAERAEAAAARQRQQEQEDRRSEKYARARSTHPLPLPQMPRLQRLGMVARVLVPRLTLRDKAIQKLLQTFVLMAGAIALNTRVMTELPGQLQALAIQNNAAGYLRLTLSGTVIRLVSMVFDLWLTWINNTLSLHWQERLTRHIMASCTTGNAFHALTSVDGRIEDADTRITRDTIDNCEKLASMFKGGMGWGGGGMSMGSNDSYGRGIIRPVCDAAYMIVLLVRVRLPTIALMTIWIYGTVGLALIKMLAPDFGHFTAEKERRLGAFRSAHARVKASAEEIAMASADDAEKEALNRKLADLLDVQRRQSNQENLWSPFEWVFTWSVPSTLTYCLRMLWSLGEGTDSDVIANADGTALSSTGQYIESLTERAFRTFGSLLELHAEMARLFGVVTRVSDMMICLEDVHASNSSTTSQWQRHKDGGRVHCRGLDIVTPNGRCLASDLSFSVDADSWLAVTGGSSSGKSSLFRVLAQLWPAHDGQMLLPSPSQVCFLSQAPLVPTVSLSLADMVMYPNSVADLPTNVRLPSQAGSAGGSLPPDPRGVSFEEKICSLLAGVHLDSVRQREGLYEPKRWVDVLSAGERQCLALARALYREPALVVLDEGLSAVSTAIKVELLEALAQRGVAVISIAQGFTDSCPEAPFFANVLELGATEQECGWALREVEACAEVVEAVPVVEAVAEAAAGGGAEAVVAAAAGAEGPQ